ncbi:MAG: hypothetical protein R2684_04600 [Pyrinomonadaceae bacterium]
MKELRLIFAVACLALAGACVYQSQTRPENVNALENRSQKTMNAATPPVEVEHDEFSDLIERMTDKGRIAAIKGRYMEPLNVAYDGFKNSGLLLPRERSQKDCDVWIYEEAKYFLVY